jgi:PPOX class probable F420-dependent enzyme
MRRRVQEARVGRLASVRPDGRPHVVPCCFVADGEVVYSAVDAKPKSSLALRRLENVRVNPSVSLLIDHYGEQALGRLQSKYEQYVREPPPGPVIALDITLWRAWP